MKQAATCALLILFAYSLICACLISPKNVFSSTATEIRIFNQSTLVFANSKVTINVTIFEKGTSNRIRVDESIKITITKPDRSQSAVESKPNLHGDYIFEFTPTIDGPWNFVISYSGDQTYAPSTLLAGCMVLLKEEAQGSLPQVALELHFPSFAIVGVPVNITATMDPRIPEAILNFTITNVHTGSTTSTNLSPNTSGDYLYTYTPTIEEQLELKVTWRGNAVYAKSECIRYLVVFNHGELDTSVEYKIMEKINSAPYINGVTIISTVYPSGTTPLSVVASGGSYWFHNMTPGKYTFSFTKPGYVNATETVTVNEGDQQHRNMFLERVGSTSTSTSIIPAVPGYPYETVLTGLLAGLAMIYWHFHDTRVKVQK